MKAGCLSVFAIVSILLTSMCALTNIDKPVVFGSINQNAIGHQRNGTGAKRVPRRRETGRRRPQRTERLVPKVMYQHQLVMPRMALRLHIRRQMLRIQMMETTTTTTIRLTAEMTKVNLLSPNCHLCHEISELTVRNPLRKALEVRSVDITRLRPLGEECSQVPSGYLGQRTSLSKLTSHLSRCVGNCSHHQTR